MQLCPRCGQENHAGVIFCENCGANLESGESIDQTLMVTNLQPDPSDHREYRSPALERDTAPLSPGVPVYMMVEGQEVEVFIHSHITLGRQHPDFDDNTLLDLTPYGAYQRGISRRHADIRRNPDNFLVLTDLGSSNGTFLNNERLHPLTRHVITHGDEIRLGEMVLQIYFPE